MDVAVVGGGDAAMDEGLFITRYASKVTVIHRRDELRASAILQERAFANPKMDFIWNTVVESRSATSQVEKLQLRNVSHRRGVDDLPVAAVFIFIGQHPEHRLPRGPRRAWTPAATSSSTSGWRPTLPGIFAAGDVRQNAARQVVSSAGDGATAAIRADHYISDHYKGVGVPANNENPMATTEWRAIWLGVCIAIVIAAALWLADVTPPAWSVDGGHDCGHCRGRYLWANPRPHGRALATARSFAS